MLLILAVIAVWRQTAVVTTVLDYGSVTADSQFGNGDAITVRTRRVKQGEVVFEQVELGPDTWEDCRGDCAEALRKQKIDFWETRRRREH